MAKWSAEALREKLAELQDTGLQLVSADRRRAAGDPVAGHLRPPPRTTSQQTEREVASVRNKLCLNLFQADLVSEAV